MNNDKIYTLPELLADLHDLKQSLLSVRELAIPRDKLWVLCEKFIDKCEIHSDCDIYQRDYVIEHASEFIEGICEIVGYKEYAE